jgi:hypothetical protein
MGLILCMMQGLMNVRNCHMQSEKNYRHKRGNCYGGDGYGNYAPCS